MKETLIRGHLGLGDGLVVNAIVRHYAQTRAVTFLAKPHNAQTLAFQWRDLDNVMIVSVTDDAVADACVKEIKKHCKETLCLGMFGEKTKYVHEKWDASMFEQAGIDHKERWNNFKCARQESREMEPLKGKYAFVHDDPMRGFAIPPEALPMKTMKIVRPSPDMRTRNGDAGILFDYWGWLDNATEIHCIDSSFAILVDHIYLPIFANKKLVLHLGLRQNEMPPARMKDFEVVKHNRL